MIASLIREIIIILVHLTVYIVDIDNYYVSNISDSVKENIDNYDCFYAQYSERR